MKLEMHRTREASGRLNGQALVTEWRQEVKKGEDSDLGSRVDWGKMQREADKGWGQSSRWFSTPYPTPIRPLFSVDIQMVFLSKIKHQESSQLQCVWFRPTAGHLQSGWLLTLGSELSQLFTERVLGLFKLSPLLLHVLHVVRQGFDLGFVL